MRRRFVPVLVSTILGAAALLKAFSLWTDALPEPGLLGSPLVQLTLIEVELAAAFGLLLAIQPALFRLIAMLLFSAFFGLALSRAASGATSCACFGGSEAIQAHPWVMVVFDSLILFLLWSWKPSAQSLTSSRCFPRRALLSGAILFLAVVPFSLVWGRSVFATPPLLLSPGMIDLGTLAQGERREFVLHLQNPHDRSVVVEQVETSCPCLEVTSLPWQFSPYEERKLHLVLDMAKEREFSGRLFITMRGGTAHAEPALRSRVLAEIVPKS